MRRLLLPLIATIATAAELPITCITVLPGGLIIERAGTMPPGEDTLSGLPATVDEGSLSVEVDGHAVDTWRLVSPEAPPAQASDPAAVQRLDAAQHAVEAAKRRRELAAGAVDVAETKDPERKPALPGPDAIKAHIAFAATNAERSATDAQAAADSADAAGNALAAAPGAAPSAPSLHAPGLSGKTLRLRYLLPGANWAPAWRLEVEGGDATLIQLATIEVQSREALPAVPLSVATRGRADAALLADPSVPILGLAESVELERKATPSAGGAKHSESTVDHGLRAFSKALRQGPGPTATEASMLLALLGAGYDHKTPNKHKPAVRAGIDRLAALDPGRLDLIELALTTTAIAEAYAMSNDPDLRSHAEACILSLRNRWPSELPNWKGQHGPLAAAQIAQAFKSSYAGGLAVGEDLRELRELDLGNGEEAEVVRLYIDICNGGKAPLIDLDTAQRWVASFDRWWNGARIELIQLAMLVAFNNGGDAWKLVQATMRERLVARQNTDGGPDDGLWPLDHHPLGKPYASAQAAMCLEIYYRYAPAGGAKSAADLSASIAMDPAPAPQPPAIQPAWPIRVSAAQSVALQPGRQVVELRRARLSSAISWEAVPVQSPGVWRRLSAPNPWSAPLPAGPVAVVADGRLLGNATLAATAPGAAVALDLGPDDRLRVRRTVRSTTDDGVFKRTLAMTISCRLEAPPGFTATVRVREALPCPDGDQIAIKLLRPEPLDGEDYAKRVAKDSLATATLSAAAPEAVLAELRLTYPRSVRPRLEAR